MSDEDFIGKNQQHLDISSSSDEFPQVFLAFATFAALAASESTTKRTRGRRPTKSRKQIILPPVDCDDLFAASEHDRDGPLIRKVQHNSECKKYFECVTNRWLIRDCPDGTTFNRQDKNCDSTKSCLPRLIDELYAEAVEELKEYMGITDDPEA